MKGDLKAAYGYLSPGYRRLKPFERWKRGIFGVGIWQDARVDKVACPKADVCDVTVLVTSRLMVPRIGKPMVSTTPVYERWVYEGGDWWYLPGQ
ncbi:hypothetical protein [Methylomarinovum tepidoasis]|uniref:hypothetical protein n=1 Tax=Methylomarinovum tepidoasis TaxID=2840183 RepID=UPI0025744C8E|nr:hypothetical protein [Methylomarinovum sp. IN45]